MEVYENIRKRRMELGWSQAYLADRMGYKNKSTISKIESGEVDISLNTLAEFAIALQTTQMKLLGWEH